MAAELFYLPFRPALDANALTVTGAQLYFYATGTTTPRTIYADAALTTPLTNPVQANAAGVWPAIYMDDAYTYRVVLKDSIGATLNDVDPYIHGVTDLTTEALGALAQTIQDNADASTAAAISTAADAAAADADRVAAQAALAATEAAQGIVTALLTGQGKPYANAYASTLPKGVTSVTIGGDPITGATVGEYAISGSGGSITGYSLTLVVTSATAAYVRVETNPDGSKATGLGSGTTPPTLTKPAGATLPAGTTLTAVVGSRIAVGEPYVVMSADGLEFLVYYNNAGAVAAFLDATSVQVAAPTSKGVAANSIHPGYADATVAEKAALACIDALELAGVPAGKYVSWKYIFWKDAGTRFNATLVMHDDLSGTGAADCCTFSVAAGADAWTTPQDITLIPSSGSTVTGKCRFTPPAGGAALTVNGASSTAAMYQRRRVSRRTYRAFTPNASARITAAARTASALRNPPADGFVHGAHAEAALYDFRGIVFLPDFTLPGDLFISKVSKRGSSNSFFAEISSVASGIVAMTGLTQGAILNATGLTGYQQFKLWAYGTATIAPIGTYLGTFDCELPADGTESGLYNAAIAFADGELIAAKIQPDMGPVDARIKTTADALAVEAGSWCPVALQGSYTDLIVEDIWIERGVPGRKYILNVRSDTAGSIRRLVFTLRDTVRGADVAYWGRQETFDFQGTLPESVQLAGATLGLVRGDVQYTGLTATVFLRPANVLFDKGVTAWTDAAYAVNTNRVLSVEQVRDMILTGSGKRNKLRTFGPGGDFATVKAAIDSLFNAGVLTAASGNADNVQRAWFPFSDVCTPSHQWTFRAMPGHTEIKLPVAPAGVPYTRGVVLWMGITVELLDDTVMQGQTTGGIETYFWDINLGGRILSQPGALMATDGATAPVVHQDAGNALSIPSAANVADPTAGQQFFQIVGLFEGGTYAATQTAWGAGTSDMQHIIWRDLVFDTADAGSNNFNTHTSPGNANPGKLIFERVTLKGGTKTIGLITSHPVAARHGIAVSDSDITAVSGGAGYVRLGKQPGVVYTGVEP